MKKDLLIQLNKIKSRMGEKENSPSREGYFCAKHFNLPLSYHNSVAA